MKKMTATVILYSLTIRQKDTGNGTPYVAWERTIHIVETTKTKLIDSDGIEWSRKTGFGKLGRKKTTWMIDADELKEIQ